MSKETSSLYGMPRPSKSSKHSITSSTDLAFATALNSLISTSSRETLHRDKKSNASTLKNKNDVFHTSNRNLKKRALADLQADDPASELRWKSQDTVMDDATWRRTKRKMEEKARLYAALKRGDAEDEGGEENPRHMVDFDRKWAEQHDAGSAQASEDDDDDDDDENSDEELVDYVDEFGRSRRGTKAQAARQERKKHHDQRLREEDDRYSARPKQPVNLIHGDTVQTAAFNPDEPIAAKMEELAKKRDREPTPPPDLHYDANAEIRNRGTGFFQFSQDAETRKQQMENLETERKHTEKLRDDNGTNAAKEERRREIERRRRLIKEKRGKAQANRFLEGLENDLAGTEIP